LNFCRKNPEKIQIKAIRPLVGSEVGRSVDRPIPAMVIAGGEVRGARNLQ
jgi:hypothetical protein